MKETRLCWENKSQFTALQINAMMRAVKYEQAKLKNPKKKNKSVLNISITFNLYSTKKYYLAQSEPSCYHRQRHKAFGYL